MKLFLSNPYCTLSKLGKVIRHEVKRYDLSMRRDNNMFIISSDRADLGFFKVDMFAKSFDLQAMDSLGHNTMYPCTVRGQRWKEVVEDKIKSSVFLMANLWIEDDVRIDTERMKWLNTVRQIDDTKTGGYRESIGDGQCIMSVKAAKALAAMSIQ